MAKKERVNKHLDWRLSARERFNYYLSDSGRLFGTSVFQTFMTAFLALRGVNLTVLASVLLVLKLIDAVDDVVFGYLIDKLKITEWKAFRKLTGEGKYLPWFRLTFFLFPLFTIVFYLMPSTLSVGAKIAWFVVSYLLYDFSCTLNEVPMNSLVMTLTDNTEERTHIITVKGIITVLAAVIVGVALNFLVDPVAGPGFSFTSVSIGAMIICTAIMIPLVRNGKEYNTELKNVEEENQHEGYTLRDMWNCVKTNKYMMVYLVSTLIAGVTATSSAVASLISFYLFEGKTMITSLPVLIAFIPGLLINTQADKISKRFGRRNSLILLGLVFGGMYILQYLVGYENIGAFIALSTIAGLANSLRYVFMNFIAPDTIEYTRYTANSKSKAQVILEQNEIDMIFCDIEMPNGNGLELLAWVKEHFPNILSVILSCHDEFAFAQRAVQLSCFDYVLKPATPEVLYPVLERAFSARKTQIQGERIRRIGEKFVGELSDHAIDREDTAQKVHQYIVNHVTEELSLEQLAQIFYLSPNYLTRCFKKKYGTTISEYIMNLRLTLAAEMLDKKEMSVTMVATKVGYPNYTYFTKIFKKKYGVSPIRYRSGKP